MKPAPFEYAVPDSLEEALALFAEHGDQAKALAGGQSLVPAMNFRLAQPAMLVDLNRVPELAFLESASDAGPGGGLRIGAMTRQRAVERSRKVAQRAPLVAETMPWIAHAQIRNRGTFGGSIAHADPASELPAVARCLGAELVLRSRDRGERQVAADDFFVALFETALEPDELLVEVRLPAPRPRQGFAFEEVARRRGDYALVGAAAAVELDEAGAYAAARVALFSVGDGPVVAEGASAGLVGQRPDGATHRAAGAAAATDDIDPPGDIHASAAFRRHLTAVLVERVLDRAAERATPSDRRPPCD